MLRMRVASSSGMDGEASYDPNVPPEKQIVTYITKEGEIRKVTSESVYLRRFFPADLDVELELQDQLQWV